MPTPSSTTRTVSRAASQSMDTVTVDVTDVPESLLTPDAAFHVLDEMQDVNALAAQAGTNAYEILTSLGTRYRRVYLKDNAAEL